MAAAKADEAFPLGPHFEVCRVRPAHFEGFGRGMRCTEAVQRGQELLSISVNKCWTAEAAKRCSQIAALGDELLEAVSDATLIALHILVVRAQGEAAEEMRREHVALILSAEFETLLDWSAEDLRSLAGSKWAMIAPTCKQDIIEEFQELEELLGDFFAAHGIDLASFLWAHRALISRSMQFFMEDGSMLYILGPGQDMFNHSMEVPTSSEDVNLATSEASGERLLVITAYKDFAEGEQAFYSYSCASNGRLLMNAGFVLAENPFDAVELMFTFPVSRDVLPLYLKLAEGLDAGIRRSGSAMVEETKPEFLETLPAGENEEEPSEVALHIRLGCAALAAQLERMLAFFRLAHLCHGGAVPTPAALASCDANVEGRAWALKQLRASLLAMQKGYERSLEEDEAELSVAETTAVAADKGAKRRAMALRVLVGEKRIYRRAFDFLEGKLREG
mmetsp:Transcript_29434/g.62661  ORF Transcript_29434/g.62661 Transcript_29434/m.62661 type:complete len:449 (+) Transcript_29434:89-1435(+)